MPTFDLELRVNTHGSVITWKVYLEDSTNDSNKVLHWDHHPDGYRVKKLPNYKINDSSLEVFAACQGIIGSTISCEVIINNKARQNKITSNVTDKVFAKQSYSITTFENA